MNIGNMSQVFNAIGYFNDCVTFYQFLRSQLPRSNGTENEREKDDVLLSKDQEDEVLKLENPLQCLQDTLCVMRNFIDQVEWRSHEKLVEDLLPKLKAALYDAEDLLEDFQCYKLKMKNEGIATLAEPGTELFPDFIQGNLNKLAPTKERLDNQLNLLKAMGLPQATLRFDRLVRPETTRVSAEPEIIGRDDEIKELIKRLGVPANNRTGPSRPKRKRCQSVPVLPVLGIGGVGKTTLAQTICKNPQVGKHFDVIAWICVSDDFDVKRLIKEAIQQFPGEATMNGSLDSLYTDLKNSLNNRRFLIVLDDMWEENDVLWKQFYAPFKDVLEGSRMLVTTRSEKVANIVGTMDPFPLEGLKDDFLLKFFKQCVFGSDRSNNNPELEQIGKEILKKLKGSPLAAKTLGRLLGRSLDPAHWNMILHNPLWVYRQEATEILPALRLSYIYLPTHLKRCFSFCAVYPKDQVFVKEDLAEIWMAEGFVEHEHNIPLQQTGCKYFEELAHLSFFQKLRGKYVMHDLIHDMAQLVSKDECFIIKERKDLERIPQNIRHLYVLKSKDIKHSDLESLCKHTKLRTLLCEKSLRAGNTVVKKWCTELLCMRVMVFDSVPEPDGLPDSISNMKNLRFLKILGSCNFNSLPGAFCCLYNLQLFCARNCDFKEVIPRGFSNLKNLQKFESKFLKIDAAVENGEGIRLPKNLNLITRELFISNLCEISKDQAAEMELPKKEYISSLTLKWSEGTSHSPGPPEHNEIEVFKALHPPPNIKSVSLIGYPGEDLPSWFNGSNDPTILSSLTEIEVIDCPRLSSLEQFLQPAYMPAIKKMLIEGCTSLEYVPVERFRGLPSLEELKVKNCPNINSQCLLAPSVKELYLENSGKLGDDIDCCSLTTFRLSRYNLASLTFNGEKFPLLTDLDIVDCRELETLNGDWPILKSLSISLCPRLKWENRVVLPWSLQKLCLLDCYYFSVRCLENLTSLKSLVMDQCRHIEYIPRDLWGNLRSLQVLKIECCKDLVSIGGPEAIAHIPQVIIHNCPKLKEVQQPLCRLQRL